jgi:hypothetical protein
VARTRCGRLEWKLSESELKCESVLAIGLAHIILWESAGKRNATLGVACLCGAASCGNCRAKTPWREGRSPALEKRGCLLRTNHVQTVTEKSEQRWVSMDGKEVGSRTSTWASPLRSGTCTRARQRTTMSEIENAQNRQHRCGTQAFDSPQECCITAQ